MCPPNQPGYNVQGYVNLIMHITMIRTQHPADLGSWRNCRFCSQLWVINMRRRVSYSWGALKISTLHCYNPDIAHYNYTPTVITPSLAPALSLSLETIGVISAEVIWSVYTEGGLSRCIKHQTACVLRWILKGQIKQRHRITRSKCRLKLAVAVARTEPVQLNPVA